MSGPLAVEMAKGRRPAEWLSAAVSLGLLCLALGWALGPAARPPGARPAPPKVRQMAGPIPRPALAPIAAIRLPPPPVGKKTDRLPSPKSTPKAKPATAPARVPGPSKKTGPKPLSAKSPAPAPAPAPLRPARTDKRNGRVFLRLFEHGGGPSIEIAWPAGSAERTSLHEHLGACLGMRLAVLDGDQRLFIRRTPPGVPWTIDPDIYSGFLRSPMGQSVAAEKWGFAAIARHHRLTRWQPVRIFPRAADATLLGGLARLIGAGYGEAKSIRAVYRLGRDGLLLGAIRVDGSARPGSIRLSDKPCRRNFG